MSSSRIFRSLFIGSIAMWAFLLLKGDLLSGDFFNILSFSFGTIFIIFSIITGSFLEGFETKHQVKTYLPLSMSIYGIYSFVLKHIFMIEINIVIILSFAIVISLIDLVVSKMVKKRSTKQGLANIVLAFPLLAFFMGFVLTNFI
ncbi:hypothetical protein [Alkalihalophilus marmarensis]|uniref:Uncharacterized protein n=1 Tax=Alkalihalophilus marmarensis DSM 21297 TaxID=1188261 RepID=U6SKG1_9BACI|nr:hypothetical protein [Alkalihalophilus marmarensis]ERN51136.1 hypothetical protein A33I_20910 [Alkalihalophilus marmarensis DSM 21297]